MGRLLICLLLVQAGAAQLPPTSTAPPATDGIILGRVLDAAANTPVPSVIVSLQAMGGANAATQRVLTDDEGRYFFDQLPPGNYSVNTTKQGWVVGTYGRKRIDGGGLSVALAEHEKKPNIDIVMWKYGVLSGTIVDESGEPLVDIEVRAVRHKLMSGIRRRVFAGSTRTDDRGMYRIAGLIPADYNVFVPATVMSGAMTFSAGNAPEEWLRTMTGEGTAPMSFNFDTGVAARSGRSVVSSLTGVTTPPSPDTPWLATPSSFAGTSGVAGARLITLQSGQERGNIDMQLVASPTYSVSGTVLFPNGSPANIALHLMSADLADFPLFDIATATADASGAFTFFGVPSGDYVIRVVRAPLAPGMRFGVAGSVNPRVMMMGGAPGGAPPAVPTEPLLHATEKVSVGAAPVRGVQIALRAGPRITGRAEFDGTAPRPTPVEWVRVSVSLDRANGYESPMPPFGRFADDGTFALPSVMPGEYYVRANAPPGWTVKSMTWQGNNLLDAPLALTGTDVQDVVVTFTDRPSIIRGTVFAPNDTPDAWATVVIFPVDKEQWTDHGANPLKLYGARTSAEGTFATRSMPAGDYYMIAIPDEQASGWQDPQVLEKLARTAKLVSVRNGESSSETLKTERIK